MDRYTVSIAQRTPAQSTAPTFTELGPVPASSLAWAEDLSREGSASATANPNTLAPGILDAVEEALDNDSDVPGLELWIYREATKVYRGPIIGLSINGTGESWAFQSAGPLYYLRYMYLIDGINHAAVDQFTIGADLVNQWQSEDWGDFGLDTSGIGTSGVTRDKDYLQGDPVFDRLMELAEVDNGFDVWVDMDDLEVHFGTKGVDRSSTVVLDRRGITDAGLSISMAAGDLASHALVVTNGDPQQSGISVNTTLRASFGRTGVVASLSETDISVVTDAAASLGGNRSQPLVAPEPKLIPVEGAGALDFEAGDTVQFVPRIGIEGLALNRRVQKKAITVGDDGNELIGVALV